LKKKKRSFNEKVIERLYGPYAIVRSHRLHSKQLELHVDINANPSIEKYDCLRVLLTRIDRDRVGLKISKCGTKARGGSKLAYRQGIIL
jgi:hypothetical protein